MQSALTFTAIALVTGFTALMIADFVSGLAALWCKSGRAVEPTPITLEDIPMIERLEAVATAAQNAVDTAESLGLLPSQQAIDPEKLLIEKLILDEPMTVEEVRELARINWLKGWQFYKNQTTLKRKLYPDLCS